MLQRTETSKDAHLTYNYVVGGAVVATIDQLRSGEWVVTRGGKKSRRFPHLTSALVELAR